MFQKRHTRLKGAATASQIDKIVIVVLYAGTEEQCPKHVPALPHLTG
jgi:hypothetical protein